MFGLCCSHEYKIILKHFHFIVEKKGSRNIINHETSRNRFWNIYFIQMIVQPSVRWPIVVFTTRVLKVQTFHTVSFAKTIPFLWNRIMQEVEFGMISLEPQLHEEWWSINLNYCLWKFSLRHFLWTIVQLCTTDNW